MTLFRGELQTKQVFPYPDPMTADDKQLVLELADPMMKFHTVWAENR